MSAVVEVAAAVLLREIDDGSEYLLAQRPEGKVYSGYWEFPGGKVEPGESLRAALERELLEELGITVERAWPWLSCEYVYPHATVRLKFFRVVAWQGEIAPIEHSGFAWIKIGTASSVSPLLPANGPILRALELPPVCALTNAAANGIDAELARLESALANGLRLIQVRDKTLSLSERLRLVSGVIALTADYSDARVLVNDDEGLAREAGAHGLHLSSARLRQLDGRPSFDWVGASCHSAEEISLATMLGLDFVLLGPVLTTASHPDAVGMGWDALARLTERSSLPVFALGGMQPDLLETAWACGAHGIALMRGW